MGFSFSYIEANWNCRDKDKYFVLCGLKSNITKMLFRFARCGFSGRIFIGGYSTKLSLKDHARTPDSRYLLLRYGIWCLG